MGVRCIVLLACSAVFKIASKKTVKCKVLLDSWGLGFILVNTLKNKKNMTALFHCDLAVVLGVQNPILQLYLPL